jgi:hypothetical protein
MEEKGFIAKTVAFLKRHAGPKTWLYSLFMENLGPKIGTAYSVYQVASIILKALVDASIGKSAAGVSAVDATTQEAMALVSMLSPMKSTTLLVALLIFNTLWVAALLARGCFKFWKIRSAHFFKFGQFGPLFGVPAQFLMGMLVVPMVLTAAVMVIVPSAFPPGERAYFWLTAFAFVCVVVAMHYFAFIEKELPNSVNYTISTGNNMAFPVAPAVVAMFDNALAGLPWVGAPEPFSASNDGRIVISIPILYSAEKWSTNEATQFGTRLHIAEHELALQGGTVLSRVIPDGIERRLALALKKPYKAPVKQVQVKAGTV